MSLISTQEVARMLCVGDRTVVNYADKGILKPVLKINNRLKFNRAQVEQFIQSGGQLKTNKNK